MSASVSGNNLDGYYFNYYSDRGGFFVQADRKIPFEDCKKSNQLVREFKGVELKKSSPFFNGEKYQKINVRNANEFNVRWISKKTLKGMQLTTVFTLEPLQIKSAKRDLD